MTRCATPKCRNRPGHGTFGSFCKRHAAILARIRDDFNATAQERDWNGSTRNSPRRGRPTCCTPGCGEPRPAGEALCAVCRAMDVDVAA